MKNEKYKNKYRIESSRLKNWNYGDNGYYFVTICTKNKIHFFGEITNEIIELFPTEKIAEKLWREIPGHFPYIKLDKFIIMPNHIHGILIIDKKDDRCDEAVNRRDAINRVSTGEMPGNHTGGITGNKNPMLNNNLSRVIRWYKGRTTFEIRKINPQFAWQNNYYDHIIRNEKSYLQISEYIINNPLKWKEDRYYG